MTIRTASRLGALATMCVLLSACVQRSPIYSPTASVAPEFGQTTTGGCEKLTHFRFEKLEVVSAELIDAGVLNTPSGAVAEHCRVVGFMNRRESPVDSQQYQIGFEMRLPMQWSGRFLYQGNGGTDGTIVAAVGDVGSGGPLTNALYKGFAVVSSDAGHSAAQNPLFGLDPQARIDYGYGAVTSLTPMAKSMVEFFYGRPADFSYIGGTSNGGRHAMVAAARLGSEFDGVLANSPGFNLPLAAAAQLYSAQQFATVATDVNNLETAFNQSERKLVAEAILERCDALDGLADGLVNNLAGCRTAFDLQRDVKSCTSQRDGSCLTEAQKQAVNAVFRGPQDNDGVTYYATTPFDPGLVTQAWAGWKFENSVGSRRDPVAVALIFQVPPFPDALADTRKFALNYSFETDFPKLFATDSLYLQSGIEFMTPPGIDQLQEFHASGGKMIVVQGVADGVFSVDDTANWYDRLDQNHQRNAASFVRFFMVPGMNHSRGGVATDQYDALDALTAWVEQGIAPDFLVASARGERNPGGVNPDVPANWSSNRTRLLCPYPSYAAYREGGDPESSQSFYCRQ